jgi:predicted RNase H-like HicB family nuclease
VKPVKLAVMIEPCEEGGFHAWVPALPGCHTEGDTEEETLGNLRQAIELYLESDEEVAPEPPVKRLEVAV